MFPKPTRQDRLRAERAADLEAREARDRCRRIVYTREDGRCQGCGRDLALYRDDSGRPVGHVDEQPPRSRGGDPTDPDQCGLLCPACHQINHALAPEYRITAGVHGWPARV